MNVAYSTNMNTMSNTSAGNEDKLQLAQHRVVESAKLCGNHTDKMTTYELDPDVVRWGLHLLDNRSLSDFGSQSTSTYRQPGLSYVEYVRENYIQAENTNVENDGVIAYALQEEFSLLAAEELSRNPGSGEEHMRASVLAQDWLGPSKGHCLSKEYVDGGAGKNVNPMVPIPHVPKTNGELPSYDEEISDHQRLLQRLELYDLFERKVQGDGNCQFRALSDQLYGSSDHHKFVREQIVNQLKSHREMYEGYVPMGYSEYSKKMNKNGEWGDHVTLQAAADWFGVKIFVITSFKDTCYIEILPHIQKSERIILLSFWAEVHYNSIYPEGDQPMAMAMAETKKKKRWWMFGIRNSLGNSLYLLSFTLLPHSICIYIL